MSRFSFMLSLWLCCPGAQASRDYNGSTSGDAAVNAIADPGAALTIAAWINPDTLAPSFQSVLLVRDGFSGNRNYSGLWLVGSGIKAYDLATAGGQQSTASVTLVTNSWQHVAMTKTSATNRVIWVGGAAGSTNTGIVSNLGSRTNVVVSTDTSYRFDGKVAELAVWSVNLSAGEMASLASGLSPLRIRPASLVFYAPMVGSNSPGLNVLGVALSQTNSAYLTDHPRMYR
jgi:hypothetical protein